MGEPTLLWPPEDPGNSGSFGLGEPGRSLVSLSKDATLDLEVCVFRPESVLGSHGIGH